MAFRAWGFWVMAALVWAPSLGGQSARAKDLATGKVLVASRQLRDPNFAGSVVLLVDYQEGGVVGLVLNRRTRIPISQALSIAEAKRRPDPVYIGGPVEEATVMALARLGADSAGAVHVLGDLYLISTKSLLAKTMASSLGPSALHVYCGYAGWTGPQLRHEVDIRGWFIFPGDAATVFDPDPGSLWSRLIEKTEAQVAMNLPGVRAATPAHRVTSTCVTALSRPRKS
ncbi:MAG: YqgE/AlgH family protein [Bryobacteraceae bacterium]|jgi:putative transcriptional regulator